MRVRCTLPNMSSHVSGVRFQPAPEGNGWVSEDLTPALASAFATIPGYVLQEEPPVALDEPVGEPPPKRLREKPA